MSGPLATGSRLLATAAAGRWWGEMWNLHVGCTPVSEACDYCYAQREEDTRFRGLCRCAKPREREAARTYGKSFWDGARLHGLPYFARGPVYQGEEMLRRPLRTRKATLWFVDGRSDLFHESIPFDQIDRAFAVMALCPQHTFIVLTKRAERLAQWGEEWFGVGAWSSCEVDKTDLSLMLSTGESRPTETAAAAWRPWPLSNVWLGVTAENQARADERVPHLLTMAAAGWKTWLSVEPMLGPIQLRWGSQEPVASSQEKKTPGTAALGGVVCGGESGTNARPMHPDWARDLRDQCAAAGTPYFLKQWGELAPCDGDPAEWNDGEMPLGADGEDLRGYEALIDEQTALMRRVGKKKAGRMLDGRTHDDLPWASPL